MSTTQNTDNIKTLTTFLQSQHSFFVVSGPKNIGKSSVVQELARERLGQFFYHDFLHIKDLSDIIWKKHSLKIELPKEKDNQSIQIDDTTSYQDIGIREINNWLQQSSLGKSKILLIENIERIVPAAANAFLKNLEEPLPNRTIIATVSHQSQLIDTILSRAIVIRFQSNIPQMLETFTNEHKDTIEILKNPWHILEKHNQLKKIYEAGNLNTFIDGRIAYSVHHNLPSDKRLEAKQLINNNVWIENVLLYAVM